jgi:hypothetical protein
MAAFAPRSTAALTLDRETFGLAERLLAARFPDAIIDRAQRLNEDVIEVLFHVPLPDTGRGEAKCAWICRAGLTVQVMDGWPVL